MPWPEIRQYVCKRCIPGAGSNMQAVRLWALCRLVFNGGRIISFANAKADERSFFPRLQYPGLAVSPDLLVIR